MRDMKVWFYLGGNTGGGSSGGTSGGGSTGGTTSGGASAPSTVTTSSTSVGAAATSTQATTTPDGLGNMPRLTNRPGLDITGLGGLGLVTAATASGF